MLTTICEVTEFRRCVDYLLRRSFLIPVSFDSWRLAFLGRTCPTFYVSGQNAYTRSNQRIPPNNAWKDQMIFLAEVSQGILDQFWIWSM